MTRKEILDRLLALGHISLEEKILLEQDYAPPYIPDTPQYEQIPLKQEKSLNEMYYIGKEGRKYHD